MWIRSQDKIYFIEVNAFEIKGNGNLYYVIGYHTENSNDDIYWYLGNYSSEEKAIKVLDMIQEAIQYGTIVKKTEKFDVCRETVFEMPQDEV